MTSHVYGFVLGVLAVLAATMITLYRYGNIRKQHVIVTLATLTAWYFSFIIVFVLPLDVSATMYKQCLADSGLTTTTAVSGNTTGSADVAQSLAVPNGSNSDSRCIQPWLSLPTESLTVFWKVVYWSAQLLTWLILPLMQSYANAGEFSVPGKIKSALIANLIYYGTYALIFGVCLIYVASRPHQSINAENLKVVGITASNTWGLFLLVLLYGYGLVDIPRSVWQSSHNHLMLQQTYFKVAKVSIECSEAQEKYEDTLEDVRRAAEVIKYNHPYRKYIDTILSKCPAEFVKTLRRNDDYQDFNSNDSALPTEKALIKMHLNVINTIRNYTRTQSQKKCLVEEAQHLEDDVANQSSSNKYFKRSSEKYDGFLKLLYGPRVEWWWRIMLRPFLLKVLAVLLAIFSIMVIWSECVFSISSPVLSLFALFIRLGANVSYISIELTSILVLAYLCVCAYRTVFKIRVFNYYYVAPNHQTDENSLLFSGMLLSRLTPPLCLNFLSLIQLDNHVVKGTFHEQTAYTEIMGHMDVVSFIANGFNIYFPIAIVLLCIATALRLGSRLLHCIGFEQFIDDEVTQDIVDEGRNHVKMEKSQVDRARARTQRRLDWETALNRPSIADQRPSEYTSRTKSKSDSGSRRGDRIELLSDQDAVDYDPESNYETSLHTGRNKPSTSIFNDL